MKLYEKKDKKQGANESSRNKLINFFKTQEENVFELQDRLLTYEKNPKDESYKELQTLYQKVKDLDRKIRVNSYFQSQTGRTEFSKAEYKRYSHPGGLDNIGPSTKLFTADGKINKTIRDHLFSGSDFERTAPAPSPSTTPSTGAQKNLRTPAKAEPKNVNAPTTQTIERGDESDDKQQGRVGTGNDMFEKKQGDAVAIETTSAGEQVVVPKNPTTGEVDDVPKNPTIEDQVIVSQNPAPAPADSPEYVRARQKLDDFLVGVTDQQILEASIYYEASKDSGGADHDEKEYHAWNKVKDTLGEGWKDLPEDEVKGMHTILYGEALYTNPLESNKPEEGDVNNDDPHNNARTTKDESPYEEIFGDRGRGDQPGTDQDQAEAEAEAIYNEARTSSAGGFPTQQDAPEFRQFNPQNIQMDIEIDDTTPAGTLNPQTGIGAGGIPTSTTGAYTSSSILNSIHFPTDEAQKLIEDRFRNKKSIEALKEEIKCMHLIYDDDIPSFKKNPHLGQKEDALESNDINKVKAHHKSMQDTIRNYYKTSDLKVGVILSAESFFGSSYASNPNLAALSQPRIPELDQSRVRAVKRGHEFDNALQGETRVNRLGRNYKKPVSRNVPKVGQPTRAAKIQEPKQIPDVEHPLHSQKGFRMRRINRNVGIPIIIKTGKR